MHTHMTKTLYYSNIPEYALSTITCGHYNNEGKTVTHFLSNFKFIIMLPYWQQNIRQKRVKCI